MSLLFLKGLQTTSSTIRNTPIISLGKRKSVFNAKAPQQLVSGLNSSATGQILARILGLPGYVPDIESGLVAMD
ncbi:hypothetical protein HN306_20585, partial [Acinetobacter baumannii]|nr:hypothetical protein [Acinetobacter baumannii]